MLYDGGWSLKPHIYLLSQPFDVSSPPTGIYVFVSWLSSYLLFLLKYIRVYEFYCTGTDLQWLPFFFPNRRRIKSLMIKWQNDPPKARCLLYHDLARCHSCALAVPGFTAACWHSSYWIAHWSSYSVFKGYIKYLHSKLFSFFFKWVHYCNYVMQSIKAK